MGSLNSYLEVVIQTSTEVHLSKWHVGQFGVKEDSELSADVECSLSRQSLLLGGDVDVTFIKFPQVFLQRQAHPSPQHV